MTDNSLNDKGFSFNKTNSLVKRAHRINFTTFVVIDESIVQRLKIDEETWFQQEGREDEIVLRIRKDERPVS